MNNYQRLTIDVVKSHHVFLDESVLHSQPCLPLPLPLPSLGHPLMMHKATLLQILTVLQPENACNNYFKNTKLITDEIATDNSEYINSKTPIEYISRRYYRYTLVV